MSSTNKTSLGLNMWEASDKPVRQDFINDNVIIDEKITELNNNYNVIVDEKISELNSNLALKANATDLQALAAKFLTTDLQNVRFIYNNNGGLNRFEFVFTLLDSKIALLWWNGTNIGYDFYDGTTWYQIWTK